MNNLWNDIRYAWRQLRNSRGFAVTAILTMALGIGANSTILSWINATLFDPIPGVAQTGRMITIQRAERTEHPTPPLSYDDYADLRDGTTSLSGLLGYHDDFMAITGTGKPERIYGAVASANYFELLGAKPVLGKTLIDTAGNERAGLAEAVLSYSLWQNRFAGDPNIVGKTIQINLHPYTIVGVAPRAFVGCKSGLSTAIWLPLGMDEQVWGSKRINVRASSWLNVLGVLRDGMSGQQADNELNVLMHRIAEQYPESHQGDNRLSTDPLWRSPFGANVYLAGTLTMLLALAAVLLLLACANVANLLLVRSVSRRREFAIRLSMGASRWRLFRQLATENLLLAAGGCVGALVITSWTARTLGSFLPVVPLPLNINGRVDVRLMLMTIAVSIMTAVLAGVVPTLRSSTMSPVAALKDESLSASGGVKKARLTSSLVVLQIALSLVLLACAVLFVRSLEKARKINPGFDADDVYLASFDLGQLGYSRERALGFQQELLAQVNSLPGVQSATLADFSPLNFTMHSDGILPEGYVPRPHESVEADRGSVAPQYLKTMHTALLEGREFTAADSSDTAPVAMVNQALAAHYWPGQEALGKHITVGSKRYTIVGVTENGKYRRLVYDPAPLVLLPLSQRYEDNVIIHVRVAGDPAAYEPAIERTIHSLNPDLPLYGVTTLASSIKAGSVFERMSAIFSASFGVLALLLAAVGIYGVVAYSTRQRTHEIGIRMALGASRADVFRQILNRGFALAIAGIVIGLVVSLAVTPYLRSMLFGVGENEWLTFAAVGTGLCLVAIVSCLVPARRAAFIEPMQALRTE